MSLQRVEAKVTHRFTARPERVYDGFLDPELAVRWRREWLDDAGSEPDLSTSEIDPVVGGGFLLADLGPGEGTTTWGRYLVLERPKKISFTWVDPGEDDDASVVTLIIEPEPDGLGSVVTLYHSMHPDWADHLAQAEKGWSAMLAGLDKVLSAS